MDALEDAVVLDFTQVIAGPACTQYLGALGAEVIKVEPPSGDSGRLALDGSFFASFNLGDKRSLSVDLKTEDGKEIAKEIASEVDVIVENFRPGVMERFGLSYEEVSEINPEVVYCSISGFGQTGPYSDRPSLDPIAQAHSGLMDITGYPDGPPARIGTSALDVTTGTIGALLVCAALLQRNRSEEGEHIDVSLFDTGISWMAYWIAEYFETGEAPTRNGSGLGDNIPYGIYSASDDELFYLIAHTDARFERLCESIGREDLLESEQFRTEAARKEHSDQLDAELEETFSNFEREDLIDRLLEARLPVGPLRELQEIVDEDPHVEFREMITDSYNPNTDTPTKTATLPYRTTEGKPSMGQKPPKLGEHSRSVLSEFGFSADFVEALVDRGVVIDESSEGVTAKRQ